LNRQRSDPIGVRESVSRREIMMCFRKDRPLQVTSEGDFDGQASTKVILSCRSTAVMAMPELSAKPE
jgi:hypothetical protein